VTVSPLTERKLREAMSRLLAGTPQHTDGALTVLRSAAEVRRDETIDTLSARLREATQQVTQLQGKLDALASVTASLYHQNQQMRRQLSSRHATAIATLPAAD
jgi:TolA-binding protein